MSEMSVRATMRRIRIALSLPIKPSLHFSASFCRHLIGVNVERVWSNLPDVKCLLFH